MRDHGCSSEPQVRSIKDFQADTRIHAQLKSRIELKSLFIWSEKSDIGPMTMLLSPDIRVMTGSLFTMLEG